MVIGSGQTVVGPRNHVVQFYAHDGELVAGVARYLTDAIQADGVAIVLATAAHRARFEAQMAAAGVDVIAATAARRLVSLDARETMARFFVEGRPDPVRFREVIGGIIHRAIEDGGPVHAYGEIVDLLWEADQVSEAIEVETLWNDLGQELAFSLFCGYRSDWTITDEHADAFQQVCSLHSQVITASAPGRSRKPSHSYSQVFAADIDSPRLARHFVVRTLPDWADDRLIADAALVVTEFAANSVMHARSGFTVTVAWLEDGVRISVSDGSTVLPVTHPPALTATSGRGLDLVAKLARDWGSEITAEGKVSWADLHRVPRDVA